MSAGLLADCGMGPVQGRGPCSSVNQGDHGLAARHESVLPLFVLLLRLASRRQSSAAF